MLYAHFQRGNGFAARAYVADPDFGVRVVSLLPDLESPTLVEGLILAGASGLDTYTHYVTASGSVPSREHDYLHVVAGGSGLHVYDITEPDLIVEVAALTDLGGNAVDVDVSSEMKPPGVDDYALVANDGMGLQVIDVTDPLNPDAAADNPRHRRNTCPRRGSADGSLHRRARERAQGERPSRGPSAGSRGHRPDPVGRHIGLFARPVRGRIPPGGDSGALQE